MGYADITMVGSDTASDLGCDIVDAIVKELKKALPDQGNRYNTNGCINVALVFEELINKAEFMLYDPDLLEIAEECKTLLGQHANEMKNAKWSSLENKNWHLQRYNELLVELEKYITNSEDCRVFAQPTNEMPKR